MEFRKWLGLKMKRSTRERWAKDIFIDLSDSPAIHHVIFEMSGDSLVIGRKENDAIEIFDCKIRRVANNYEHITDD
jgi:hypothetical protein